MTDAAKEITKKVTEWAAKNEDIVYVLIAGSQGRSGKKSDEYSDIDVVMFAKNITHYQKTSKWISDIDKPVLYFEERLSGGIPTQRVFFPNAVGMDIFFINEKSISRSYQYVQLKEKKSILFRLIPSSIKRRFETTIPHFIYFIHRGYETLLDKKDYAHKLATIERAFRYKKENAYKMNEIENTVNKFWYKAHHVAVKLFRREPFTAKVDGSEMMILVLSIIELHTKVKKGKDFETWHRGRYIEEWAEPFITERIKKIFSPYDIAESWKSLAETMDLFSEVMQSIESETKGIRFINPEPYMRKWIEEIRAKSEQRQEKTIAAGVFA